MIRNVLFAATLCAFPLSALSATAVKLSYSSGSADITTDGISSETEASGFAVTAIYDVGSDFEISAGYANARGDITSFGLTLDYEYEGLYVTPKYFLLNSFSKASSSGSQIYSSLTFSRDTTTIADDATTENTTSVGIGAEVGLGNGLSVVATLDSDIDHFGDDKNYSFGVNFLIEGNHEIAAGISTTDSNTDGDTLSYSGYYLSYYMYF